MLTTRAFLPGGAVLYWPWLLAAVAALAGWLMLVWQLRKNAGRWADAVPLGACLLIGFAVAWLCRPLANLNNPAAAYGAISPLIPVAPGWNIWLGMVLAGAGCVMFAVWQRVLRGPLIGAALAGAAVWAVLALGCAVFARFDPLLQLPRQPLPALAGGDALALNRFTGAPTVVNLWATWCPPCQRELPLLAGAQAAHPRAHIVFVDQGETVAAVRAFLQSKDLALHHVMLDANDRLSRQWGSGLLPMTLFFDRDGHLRTVKIGALTAPELQQKLASIAVSP